MRPASEAQHRSRHIVQGDSKGSGRLVRGYSCGGAEVIPEGFARILDFAQPRMNRVEHPLVPGAMSEILQRGGNTVAAVAPGISRNTVIETEGERKVDIEPRSRASRSRIPHCQFGLERRNIRKWPPA